MSTAVMRMPAWLHQSHRLFGLQPHVESHSQPLVLYPWFSNQHIRRQHIDDHLDDPQNTCLADLGRITVAARHSMTGLPIDQHSQPPLSWPAIQRQHPR